jgi:tetratricopeptide (TPR) repeat protein
MLVLGAADRLCGSARRLARSSAKPASRRTVRALRRPLGHDRGETARATGTQASLSTELREAMAAANEGRLEAAVELTARLLAENPLDADAHFVRGLAELGLGDAQAAAGSFRRALYVDPSFGLAAFKLGRAHEACSDHTAAARAYDQALRTLADGDARHAELLGGTDIGDVAAACGIRLRSLAPIS